MSARGAVYSGGIHLVLIMLAILGLPEFFKKDPPPEPIAIVVELLPITDITNVKPDTVAQRKKTAKPKKVKIKPKEKPAPTKQDKPKPEPKPKPKSPVKVPLKEKPKPEPKPKKKKPEIKKEDEAVLKDKLEKVKKAEEKPKPKDKPKDQTTQKAKAKSSKPFSSSIPMSRSETDALVTHFESCWGILAGAKNDRDLKVEVKIKVRKDGWVTHVTIVDKARYRSDSYFRAAADQATRAINKCKKVPSKYLPAEKYETWKDIKLRFDPSDLL